MVRLALDETKLKLDLPLLKHKAKEKQVEISHAAIYDYIFFHWLLFPAEMGRVCIFPSIS